MAKLQYPLKQILDVKLKRVEDAERAVKEKIKALEIENEKLAKRIEEKEKVQTHYSDKLGQLRNALDEGTTTVKIQQMKVYLKVVKEKLKVEEKKVKEQEEQVDLAKKNLELARLHLFEKRKEVDKLETHKKEWEKETRKEIELQEEAVLEEIGSTMYLVNFNKKQE